MPMLDAFIPDGALTPAAEARLLEELTEILIRLEGLDPTSPQVRDVSVIYLHRPAVFAAGAPVSTPRYRFIPTVPEGQYDDAARSAVVAEMTAAVARAEGRPLDDVSPRVWVFPTEMPDGQWGGRGRVQRLPDILGRLVGEAERQVARDRLAERRRTKAQAILDAARGG